MHTYGAAGSACTFPTPSLFGIGGISDLSRTDSVTLDDTRHGFRQKPTVILTHPDADRRSLLVRGVDYRV